MAPNDCGPTAATITEQASITEQAKRLLSTSSVLEQQVIEFLNGSRPTECEKVSEASLPALDSVSVMLGEAIRSLENISRAFQSIVNKVV